MRFINSNKALEKYYFSDGKSAKFRDRKKFLWWPKKINDETRWLEVSSWGEILNRIEIHTSPFLPAEYQYFWEDYFWI